MGPTLSGCFLLAGAKQIVVLRGVDICHFVQGLAEEETLQANKEGLQAFTIGDAAQWALNVTPELVADFATAQRLWNAELHDGQALYVPAGCVVCELTLKSNDCCGLRLSLLCPEDPLALGQMKQLHQLQLKAGAACPALSEAVTLLERCAEQPEPSASAAAVQQQVQSQQQQQDEPKQPDRAAQLAVEPAQPLDEEHGGEAMHGREIDHEAGMDGDKEDEEEAALPAQTEDADLMHAGDGDVQEAPTADADAGDSRHSTQDKEQPQPLGPGQTRPRDNEAAEAEASEVALSHKDKEQGEGEPQVAAPDNALTRQSQRNSAAACLAKQKKQAGDKPGVAGIRGASAGAGASASSAAPGKRGAGPAGSDQAQAKVAKVVAALKEPGLQNSRRQDNFG